MLTNPNTVDDINFLTQSPVRVQILELLREEGELTKSELTDQFDVSRVTIQRNVEALEQRDWIDNSHPTYATTPLGEMVIDEVSPLTESIEIAQKLRPFLKWVPRDSFDLDPHTLADATVIEADRTNPTDWVYRHTDRIRSASYAWALLPGTGMEAWEAAVESSSDSELESQIIVTPDVAETLETDPEYTEKIEILFERNALELYVYDGSIPYHLGRLDQYIYFVAVDDTGLPQAYVETESDAVYDWAEAKFDSYRARAGSFEF